MTSDSNGTPPVRPRVELTPEQRAIVEALFDGLKAGKTQQTLGGYAGTGKTTLIGELLALAKQSCAVVAYTARAARVLRSKGITNAGTIHSLMYTPIAECTLPGRGPRCHPDLCRCRIVGWQRNEVLGCDLIIVDEASMVGHDVHRDMMSYGVPAIFVGDHGQLPPIVEDGQPPFNLMEDPEFRLEHIHRNAGDIARFAERLRNDEPAFRFRPRDGSVLIAGKDESFDRLPIMSADRVICARNRTRGGLNAYYRRAAGRNALVEPGETVMCLKNDRNRRLFNGTLARVLSVTKNTFDLDSEEGTFSGVRFDPHQFGSLKPPEMRFGKAPLPFDYGYASTCHKAQGGEWPYVLVIEEFLGNRPWEHRRWAYTAASRARRRLVWRASTRIFSPSYVHPCEIGGVR